MPEARERWWFVTWTTCGTWLPGDPRGFQTWRGREYVPPPKRYAQPGEATYDPIPYRELRRQAQAFLAEPPARLDESRRSIVAAAFAEEFDLIPPVPSVLAIDAVHVHLLVRTGSYSLRNAAGRLKAAASRHLHLAGFTQRKVWCQGCHLKSKDTPAEIRGAFDYICRHQREGVTIHIWRHPLDS